jgi:hypothetical protein
MRTKLHLKDRQCTYDVTLRRVRESLLPWKSNKYYVFRLCKCLCVCLGARARGRVRVALFIQHATRMRHILT